MIAKIGDKKLRQITSYASVLVATSLIFAKIGAFLVTGSVALLSSLVDSGVDLLASLITAYGVSQALQPPDRDHRFGHGKAEPLAALAQAAFIFGSSILVILEAADRFVTPKPIENPETGFLVMGFAIVMTVALLALQTYTIARTKSLAIRADRMHYLGDVLINLAVIATIFLQDIFEQTWIDPVFAIAIALSMIFSAVQISRKALTILMDTELPEAERQKIIALAKETPGVRGVHDLRTRTDSGHPFIEIHLEISGSLSLKKAHDISDAATAHIRSVFPGADILVHQDPAGLEEDSLDAKLAQTPPHNAT